MTTRPIYLSHARGLSHMWAASGETSFDVQIYSFSKLYGLHHITDRNLARHHPMLGPAIRARIAYNLSVMGNPRVEGGDVIAMLEVLTENYFTLTDADGRKRNMLDIFHFDNSPKGDVGVGGFEVDIDFFETGGQLYPFVKAVETETFTLVSKTLDLEHPRWEMRLLMGQDLGLEWNELMQYVFSSPKPLQNVVIPGDLAKVEPY